MLGTFSKKTSAHWKNLGQLEFTYIIMLEVEELSYELLILNNINFVTKYLDAQSIVLSVFVLIYIIPVVIDIFNFNKNCKLH